MIELRHDEQLIVEQVGFDMVEAKVTAELFCAAECDLVHLRSDKKAGVLYIIDLLWVHRKNRGVQVESLEKCHGCHQNVCFWQNPMVRSEIVDVLGEYLLFGLDLKREFLQFCLYLRLLHLLHLPQILAELRVELLVLGQAELAQFFWLILEVPFAIVRRACEINHIFFKIIKI